MAMPPFVGFLQPTDILADNYYQEKPPGWLLRRSKTRKHLPKSSEILANTGRCEIVCIAS
jgi:hypothetical protein